MERHGGPSSTGSGGGRWRVVARTTDTAMEDGGALPGAVSVHAVSATANGERSAEIRSGY
jgi:hypothetical protein